MAEDNGKNPTSPRGCPEQRRHTRKTVFKSALLYPVQDEVGLSVENVSHSGLSCQCVLVLGLLQQVHVSFDGQSFRSAEVRWVKGTRCGLLMEEPLLWIDGIEIDPDTSSQNHPPREHRVPVTLPATLITSAPVLPGTIRNMSVEGMMIEVGCELPEGMRLLVKSRDSAVRLGRVQWSAGGMAGLFFEPPRKPLE
ncbi:PilZ domain-containing protein [Sphingobium sp. TB-6]|uniref:PilZ domain-containing protein n=1 Tax=Sphingobium sp. TB-6 TaxID=2728850 RepID=UPI003211CC0B